MKILEKYKGEICIFLAIIFILSVATLVKLSDDIRVVDKLFYGYLLMFIMAYFSIKKKKFSFKPVNTKLLIIRCISGVFIIGINYFLYDKLQIKDNYAIEQIFPFIAIFLSAIFLKEKIRLKYIVATIITVIGALMIVKVNSFDYNIYVLIRLLMLFVSGVMVMMLRVLRRTEKTDIMLFWYGVIACIMLLPFIIVDFEIPDVTTAMFLFGISLSSYLFQYFNTKVYKYLPVGKIAIYRSTEIIFSVILGVIIFGEKLIWLDYIGIGLILVAAYINFKEKKEEI